MMTATTVELQRTGRALGVSGAALGALGLVGWFFEAETATTFIAGRPAMMPNSALSLLILGLAATMHPPLASTRRIWTVTASVLGLSVLAIAVTTVVEYVTGWNLGIDQVLVSGGGASTYPGRPSPITAAALTLMATALLLTDRRTILFARLAEWLTLAAAFLSFVSIVGHLFGAGQIYEMRTGRADGVALPTAIRVQQVLGNLLNNAIKFTPAGGRVLIVAHDEGDEIRFAVTDTGPGISPDHLPRIFDRFRQAGTGDRRGAGLGLAIAKGIVEAHGGHMRAESVFGKGSTSSFTLRVFCSPRTSEPWSHRAACNGPAGQ